mgnify:CR=1 FL=1
MVRPDVGGVGLDYARGDRHGQLRLRPGERPPPDGLEDVGVAPFASGSPGAELSFEKPARGGQFPEQRLGGGASERDGYELTLFWRPIDWIGIDAVYTGSNAHYQNNPEGRYVEGAVEHSGQLGLSAVKDRWEAGLRVRYLGPYALTPDNAHRAEPATTVNLRSAYTVGNLTLYGELINLFDADGKERFSLTRRAAGAAGSSAARRLRSALVVAELALAVVLAGPVLLGVIVAVVASFGIGAFIERFVMRRFQNGEEDTKVVATIGLLTLITGLIGIVWSYNFIPYPFFFNTSTSFMVARVAPTKIRRTAASSRIIRRTG